jgi:hypothetical protein
MDSPSLMGGDRVILIHPAQYERVLKRRVEREIRESIRPSAPRGKVRRYRCVARALPSFAV